MCNTQLLATTIFTFVIARIRIGSLVKAALIFVEFSFIFYIVIYFVYFFAYSVIIHKQEQAGKNTMLYIAIGCSCFIALIFALICLLKRHRARYLGVVPENRNYSLLSSSGFITLSSPKVSPTLFNFKEPPNTLFPPSSDNRTPIK